MLTAATGPGAERLEIEAAYDRTVRAYIEDKGTPDYILVEERSKLLLIYVERDEAAVFTRGFMPDSQVAVQKPIPDSVLAEIEGRHGAKPEKEQRLRTWAYKRLDRANELLDEHKYPEALNELDAVKGNRSLNDHERAVMWQIYGYIYYSQDKYAEAIESFETCLELDALDEPTILKTQHSLGQLYLVSDRFDEALSTLVDWYGKTEAPSSDDEYSLALAHARTKRHAEAISHIERAIAGSSVAKESWYRFLLGQQFELTHYQEARQTLELLVIQFPKEEYWGQLTHALVLLDQWDDLVNLLNEGHTDLDTVMSEAASAGRSKIVELAVARGADVNAGGPQRWTALQLAARAGRQETVRLLLDLGSDPTASDSTGRTAAQLAAENGHPSVARLLLVSAREWRLLHR